MDDRIGKRFARALADKDREALLEVLDPNVDFRAMTPDDSWEASSAKALVDEILFGAWFEPGDHIDSLDAVETGTVANRHRVSYRLRVHNPGGAFLLEQQAYFDPGDDRIKWLRIMCSGFQPVDG
jgi:hypothetical protein